MAPTMRQNLYPQTAKEDFLSLLMLEIQMLFIPGTDWLYFSARAKFDQTGPNVILAHSFDHW